VDIGGTQMNQEKIGLIEVPIRNNENGDRPRLLHEPTHKTWSAPLSSAIMVPDAVIGGTGDQSDFWCRQFSPVYRVCDPALVSQAFQVKGS